jgi:dihydroflavonol-4-reductase
VDAVIHAAAEVHIGWRQLAAAIETNAGITARLAALAAERRIRMIHVSTVDTLAAGRPGSLRDEESLEPAKPPTAYVVSKRIAERSVLEAVTRGLDGVIVNPGFMVGPWDWKPSSGQMILTLHQPFVLFAPRGGCSVVDVRDVARGILAALQRGRAGERYILAGHNVTYMELWTEISRVIGGRSPRLRLGPVNAWLAGAAGDVWGLVRGKEGLLNSAVIRMGQLYHYYSSEKAARQLGYSISPYQPALADAWAWLLQHGYVRHAATA